MTVSELRSVLDSCHPHEQVVIGGGGNDILYAVRTPGADKYGRVSLLTGSESVGDPDSFFLYPDHMKPGRQGTVYPDANEDNAACRVCSKLRTATQFRRTLRRD